MQTIRDHASLDRYVFDLGVCSFDKGFCQIDVDQDALYFGTGAHRSAG